MVLEKRVEFKAHSASIYTIDGFDDYIFTGSGDNFVAKWNLKSGIQEKFSIKVNSAVYKIKLVRNKDILIIGTNDGSLHVIDLLEKKEIRHFVQHKTAIFEIQENTLKSQLYTTDFEGNLAVWGTQNFDLLLFLPLQNGKIRQVLVDESGEFIYIACQNGEIKKFDTQFFNEIASFEAHALGVNCLNFHPTKNNILISCGKDGLIKFWDLEQENKLILEIPAHNFGIYQLDFFNQNENFITISRDKSIKLWDTKNLKVIQKIELKQGGHSHSVNAFWKKSETEFVTVGDDKRIIYWELKN
ncbi:MAG: WD40 repeat domain-containing protein [Bacteroidota bacterium]